MRSSAPRMQVRLLATISLLLLLAGVLLGRLGQLQLTDSATVAGASDPVTARVPLPALRGRILDRHGEPLVDNAVRTDITVDRATLADAEDGGRATVRSVARALDLPFDRLWGRTTLCGAPGAADPPLCWPGSALVPVPLVVDVDPAAAAALVERPEHYPGVSVTTQPVRSHPGEAAAPQTVGYLTRATEDQVEGSDGTIPARGLVGAGGLEQQYDELLRGRAGEQVVSVDARGVAVEEVSRTEPTPGDDLVTTLDLGIQRASQQALARGVARARDRGLPVESGAAVVLDLRDGGVLASASWPTYDPSVWSRGITQAEYDRLTKGEDSPLLDRVTGVAHPPASTFKTISLPGAVASGVDLEDEVDCTSAHRIGDRVFTNFESRAYGRISWRRAIAVSCDTVFYRVAEDVWRAQGGLEGSDDGDALIETARLLGLGAPTGIDVPGEAPGRIPDRAWRREWWESTKEDSCRRARTGYPDIADRSEAAYLREVARENCRGGYLFRPGDEANLSIGQGDVTATVLQMVTALGAVADEGTLVRPHLAQGSAAADGGRESFTAPTPTQVDLPGESGDLLRRALVDVVEAPGGTARAAFAGFPLEEWGVAGKTGTAEVHGQEDTSWFVSYAPTDDPRYAVGVVVPRGGTGASTAAPIAREIHEALARDAGRWGS